MKIQSCENCGILIDTDRIKKITTDDYLEDNPDNDLNDKFMWDGDGFVQKLKCPVCNYDGQGIE